MLPHFSTEVHTLLRTSSRGAFVCHPAAGNRQAREVDVRGLAARPLRLVVGLLCCFASLLVVDAASTAALARGARKPPRHGKDRLAVSLRLTDGARTVVRTRRELGFRL